MAMGLTLKKAIAIVAMLLFGVACSSEQVATPSVESSVVAPAAASILPVISPVDQAKSLVNDELPVVTSQQSSIPKPGMVDPYLIIK